MLLFISANDKNKPELD